MRTIVLSISKNSGSHLNRSMVKHSSLQTYLIKTACHRMTAIPSLSKATIQQHLTVRLLGDFLLLDGDLPLDLASTPRLQALLAYLLLHRQAPQSRRRLAFLFWPDSAEAQALTNLRKQLLYSRKLLPPS